MSAAMVHGPPMRGGPGGGPGGPPAAPPWVPKTELGRRVASGEIATMSDALATGLPLREAPIVDKLLPGLHDEVLDVNMVQRMTDSGRRGSGGAARRPAPPRPSPSPSPAGRQGSR